MCSWVDSLSNLGHFFALPGPVFKTLDFLTTTTAETTTSTVVVFKIYKIRGKQLLQNVGCVPWTQEPCQDQPCAHWQYNFQTSLHLHGDVPPGFFTHCDNAAVCWQSHWLCSHQRHPRGCAQYLLLDPFNLHHTQCLLETYWHWRGSSGHWQDCWPGGEKIRQILPMGLLLSILSGKQRIKNCVLFHSQYVHFNGYLCGA